MVVALLDRVVHHCHIVNIRGTPFSIRHHVEPWNSLHIDQEGAMSENARFCSTGGRLPKISIGLWLLEWRPERDSDQESAKVPRMRVPNAVPRFKIVIHDRPYRPGIDSESIVKAPSVRICISSQSCLLESPERSRPHLRHRPRCSSFAPISTALKNERLLSLPSSINFSPLDG